jgi:hypothetical protein
MIQDSKSQTFFALKMAVHPMIGARVQVPDSLTLTETTFHFLLFNPQAM